MKSMTTMFALALTVGAWVAGGVPEANAAEGCLSCHEGIEDIRDPNSAMMAMIKAKGASVGDPAGCVVCHGGDPTATEAEKAHSGSPEALVKANGPETYYPDPGSVWIAEKSCVRS